MTENNPYPAQVADLITAAVASLADALTKDPGPAREALMAEAYARSQVAQALATLAHAHETRVLALATLAGLDPRAVHQAGALPIEAYTAAGRALGMIEDAPAVEAEALEALRRKLTGRDPADADLGDLK